MLWALGVVASLLSAAAPAPGAPRPPGAALPPGDAPRLAAAEATARTATVAASGSSTTTADPLALVRGEITHAGSVRLIPKASFIGARLGVFIQDTTVFMTIAPKADLLLLEGRLKIGVEIPLNLQLYSGEQAANAGEGKKGFSDLGSLRKQDYDDERDYVKILRYFSYGQAGDPFYLSIGQLYASTLGHGMAMRRYAANIDLDSTKVGTEVRADLGYAGFQLELADVTRANLFASQVFVRPLSPFFEEPILRSLAIGLSWASDQKAPIALRRGPRVGSADVGPVLVDELGVPRADTRAVNIYGLTSEVTLAGGVSSELKSYLELSHLGSAGSGASLGLLWYFGARSTSFLHLLKARLELRTYAADFQPSYFDVLYEFQKYEFIDDPEGPSRTKLAFIRGRQGGVRGGFYLEVSYAMVDHLIVALAFEADTRGEDRNLMLHAEVPLGFLDLFATYQQRSFARLLTFDENDVFFAGARLRILPVLFLNGRLQKNFVWDPSLDAGLGGYAEQINYQGDIEAGFQF